MGTFEMAWPDPKGPRMRSLLLVAAVLLVAVQASEGDDALVTMLNEVEEGVQIGGPTTTGNAEMDKAIEQKIKPVITEKKAADDKIAGLKKQVAEVEKEQKEKAEKLEKSKAKAEAEVKTEAKEKEAAVEKKAAADKEKV